MKDLKRIVEILILFLSVSFSYFFQGLKNKRLFSHFRIYLKEIFLHLESFSKYINEHRDIEDLQSSKYHHLQQVTTGLHGLLTDHSQFKYSILISVGEDCSERRLKTTLDSVLNLTAPFYEVLVGLSPDKKEKFNQFLFTCKNKHSDKLKIYDVDTSSSPLSSARTVNLLAEQATGNYLFIVETGDWLRPDILYRYEQTLNFFSEKDNIVLFCDEYQVNASLTPIPGTRSNKPDQLQFPYIFTDDFGRTLLIPKKLWDKIGGLQEKYDQLHLFDLPLRLSEVGAQFHKIPIYLYALLKDNKEARDHLYSLPDYSKGILEIYSNYSKTRNFNWQWKSGNAPNSVRAIPELKNIPYVHVVLLFKDQHNLTLSAVKHIQEQVGVQVFITAVDNNSKDFSIGRKLEDLGVEVIRVEEPFNYSRLNNLAVRESRMGKLFDHILFINNDVDLERSSLLEMCGWINQPGIGLVGCRLNYPNGTLQHGGVIIESSRAAFIKSWHHVERTEKFKRLQKTHFLRVTAAVTAACCLIKRSVFLEVGGFDETWFPIAFSDTALAVKVRAKGMHCFYTPYAVGVHHESISRKKVNIEDYESSTWVHRQFVQKLWKDQKIHFEELKNVEY